MGLFSDHISNELIYRKSFIGRRGRGGGAAGGGGLLIERGAIELSRYIILNNYL